MVGDWVEVTIVSEGDSMIEAIRPRTSILKRADQSGHAMGYVTVSYTHLTLPTKA